MHSGLYKNRDQAIQKVHESSVGGLTFTEQRSKMLQNAAQSQNIKSFNMLTTEMSLYVVSHLYE